MTREIYIAALWDRVQIDPAIEFRQYRQLLGAYGVAGLLMAPRVTWLEGSGANNYDTLQAALEAAPDPATRVFLCPSGDCALEDVPPGSEPLVIVIGDTTTSPAELAGPNDIIVSLPAPNPVELYGVNAAAVALAELYRTGRT